MEIVSHEKRNSLYWLRLSFFVIVADQLAKYLVSSYLNYNKTIFLLPFLNFTLAHNKGAAFSFLSEQGHVAVFVFIASACIISFLLCLWMYRLHSKNNWLAVSLALILGGAVGNLLDRIFNGYVVDFIHFHIGNWSFPIFNVADTAITIGAIMLIIEQLFPPKNQRE